MVRKNFTFNLIVAFVLGLLFVTKVRAEDFIARISPPRNALNVRDTSRIIIVFNFHIDAATLQNNAIKVSGSQSGVHRAKIAYETAKKTATIISEAKFLPGETVNVLVKSAIKTNAGLSMPEPYQWSFIIQVNAGSNVFAPTSKAEVISPYGIVAGDFDLDGDLDLAVTSRSENKIAVLKNDGFGRFAPASTALVGSTPSHLAAGDLDGDGDMDLAVANTNGNTLTILKNDGSGVFKALPTTLAVSSAPLAPVTGDFDGDGDLDLAVSNNGNGGGNNSGVSILMNNGAAGFQKTATLDAVGCEFAVIPGDWDDDGDLDLAASSHCLFGVSILYNDGKGNFRIVTRIEAGAYPSALAAADLNDDGDVDLVTPNRNDASSANGTVSILSNRDGDFKKSGKPFVAGAHPGAVMIGDFDRDGRLDLAVANNPAGTISFLHNDGAGEFTLVATPPAGIGPDFIASGDFDGDGDLDLAATNFAGNTVTILKNGVTELVKIAATSGQQQRGVILTALKNSLTVTATDAQGKPVSGVNVNFAIASVPHEATGHSLSATSVTTGNDGKATAGLKLGSKAGTYTVTVTAEKLNDGAPVTFTATAIAGAAASISSASGDRQVGKINSALSTPLLVTVTDLGGNVVAGASVNFAIASAPAGATGQFLSETNPITNSYGQATAVLQLGNKIGEYRVMAFLPGNEGAAVAFIATAEAGNLKTIKLTAGNGQTALIKTALGNPFEVTITDEGGNPVPNLTVTFLVTKTPANASGHRVNPALISTNSNGKAAAVFTLGNKSGNYEVTATAANVIGNPILFSATAIAGAAAKIFLTSGNHQSGAINTSLSQPLVTTVTDVESNPVANANMSFTIKTKPAAASGEALSLTGVKTNNAGRATTILTLGNKVGIYTVTAVVNGLSGSAVEFTATANAGTATTMTRTSGHAQTRPINTALAEPFVVTVTDAGGNPASGVAVVFELDTVASASPAKAGLSQYVDTTDGNGRASTLLTLGSKSGSYRVRAAATGLIGSPIEFLATATVGPAAKISRVSGHEQTGKTNSALANPLVVKVVDVGGNSVAGVNVNFGFAATPAGAVGHSLRTTNELTNNNGRAATFLTFGNQPGIYTVTASAIGLSGSPLTFTATADLVNNLKTLARAGGDNQRAPINTATPDSFIVKVTDAANNPVAGIGVMFALAAFPNDATGQMLGRAFVSTGANGLAATALHLGNKIGAYTVTASATGLLNSPIEFTATATTGAAANLTLLDGDQQAGTINTALQKPLVVTATDAGGNAVAGTNLSFEIFSFPNGATGQRLSQSQLTTDNNGQAATIFTLGDKLGNYIVTAKVNGLNTSAISFTARAEFTGRAEKILPAAGNNRDGQILASLAEPFVVTVTDLAGNPIADYTVAFNIDEVPADATRHSLNESFAKTDKDGRAAAILTLGSKAGAYKVSAIAPKLNGSPVTFTARATPGAAATMLANTGDNQNGKIKKALANPFGVIVTDTEGNPVSGAEVSFTVKAPSGANGHALNPATVKTTASGEASTSLTLGDKTGKYIVEAGLNGLFPVRFSAQANSEPPVIAAPSLPGAVTKAEPVAVRANISDDIQVAIAKLFYRKGGEINFTEAPMTKGNGNNFQLDIPANAVTSRGVEFFISAGDEDGNSIRYPLSGIISIPVNIGAQGEQKSSAQPADSYRLISVPLNLADKTPRGVLKDDLGPYERTKWRFYALQADQSYAEFPNGTMESGKAFWLIVKESGRRIRIGPGVSNSTAEPYVIPLHAGWNFIGNPFNFPTKAQARLGDGAAFGIYSFDGTWSDPQSPELKELQPFDGYAVFTRAATTLVINSDRAAAANLARMETASPAWSIRIIAECGDALDRNNLAAIAAGASREWDENDYPEPPVIGDYVSVYFPHPEWGPNAYNYCTDTRPEPQNGEIWEFAVRSNMGGKVQLTFAGVESVPPEYEVWLIDEAIGIAKNLRATNQYAVAAAGADHCKTLKLMVGKENFVAEKLARTQTIPAAYELSQNFPNPFWSEATSSAFSGGNPATTIRYGLPRHSRVTLKVFNALGEEIATLLNDVPQSAGYHAAIWDGRNKFGKPAASGLFFYRLQAGDWVMTKKMVLVK